MEQKFEENVREKSSESGIYYKKIADKYRIARYLLLILCLLFFVLAVIFQNDQMRGVHFRYLTKYFDINPFTLDERYEDIVYAVGGGSQFALFHDDLAVLGEGRFALYDLRGDLEYRANIAKGKLAVENDGKYLAAYALGDQSLSLFHSFGEAESLTFPGSITNVCVSKNGVLAVCLNTLTGTEIHYLNDRFETEHILKPSSGVVIDMAISDDGKSLSVLLLDGIDGSYYARFELWSLKKGELEKSDAFQGRKPIATGFFENGNFFLLFDRAIRFCSQDGDILDTLAIATDPLAYDVHENELLLSCLQNEITIYKSDGKKRGSFLSARGVLDAKLWEDDIYILSQEYVSVYESDGTLKAEEPIASGALAFYILDDKSILLCYSSETTRITPAQ